MTSYAQARTGIISLLPDLPGWNQVYTDGIATGKSPPWIVVSLSEKGREGSEGGSTNVHHGVLDIRVVSPSELSIGIVCDKLTTALDHASPNIYGVASLIPDTDSGVYASELTNTDTGTPFMMRVLTWRTGWPA